MSRKDFESLLLAILLGSAASQCLAQDAASDDSSDAASDDGNDAAPAPQVLAAVDPDRPREMSGMSILGNEEAPKALVIVPWKSSELGDEIGIPESPDDKPTPVDRDVFLRELRFYEIRKDEQ